MAVRRLGLLQIEKNVVNRYIGFSFKNTKRTFTIMH